MRDILSIYFNKFSDDIKTIVHVGAHFGQEVEFYKTHKPNEIHLFEPNPSVFKKLEKNIEKFQNVSIYNFALGSNQDFVNFYVSNENDGESSSILEPSGHLIAKPEISFHLSSEKVQVQRFDYFGISNIDFVNIDTQGYELEVIKGFGEELKNIKFLHCEINRNYVYKNNTLVNDLDSYLDKNNFIKFALSPIAKLIKIIEIESIKKLLTPSLREKIKVEAQDLNLLKEKKGAKLPI